MKPVKVIYLPTEPTEKKSVWDMTFDTVDGYLLAEHVEKQINDLHEIGFIFLKMEAVSGTRYVKGSGGATTLGYLLFFEKISSD